MNLKRSMGMVSFFGLSTFFLGALWTILFSASASADTQRELKTFTDVLDIVKRNYVEEPEDETLVSGAIRGMLSELDPHSIYLSKEEFQDMQVDTRGEFGGLGIQISKKDGVLTVISPIEDTPADKAGIKAGDIIAKIEDKFTDKMSIFDAVKLMRGKPGTKISISVKREGVKDLIPFVITRAVVHVKSVASKKVNDFGVIRISQFSEKTSVEVKKALKKFRKDGEIKGLVLDLRRNPGGLLQQAVEVSDLFLNKGMIVYTQGRDKKQIDRKFAVAKGTEPDYPLTVLVDAGSASASEIVAGALQDQKRAYVIGTKTFGKGSVQHVIPLDNGGGVKLTVARFYTPSGRSIQADGIMPDQIVEALETEDSDKFLREKDLEGHLIGENEKVEKEGKSDKKKEVAEKKKNKKKIDTSKLTELEKEDYQLAKAIAYLKSKSGAQSKKR